MPARRACDPRGVRRTQEVPLSPSGPAEHPAPGEHRGPAEGSPRPAAQGSEALDATVEPARRRAALLLGVAAVVLLTDLATKVWVVAVLEDAPPVRLLGGFLTLTHARNPGAAFSIGTSATLVFTLIAIAVVAAVLRIVPRVRHGGWGLALGLLLGGAAGNLVDRLFREPGPLRGAVVDWIRVPNWPTFNVADCGIVVGGILAAWLSTRGVGLDGSRHPDDHAAEGPAA